MLLKYETSHMFSLQDNYNALHISAMYSREDVVKLLLSKRGVDPYATGGVRIDIYSCNFVRSDMRPQFYRKSHEIMY